MAITQIALEIDGQQIRAFQLSDGEIRLLHTITLPNTESEIREHLDTFCSGLPKDADEYSCSWSDPHMTLVPAGLIGTVKPSEMLNITSAHGSEASEVDYNRLMSWNMAVVYHSPAWLKGKLILRFPRIIIQHEVAHVLHYLNSGSTVLPKTVVVHHGNNTCFVIRNQGNIVHCSYQVTETAEDILYHLLYCFAQHQISGGELLLYSSNESGEKVLNDLRKYSEKVEELKKMKITVSVFGHINFQKFCV